MPFGGKSKLVACIALLITGLTSHAKPPWKKHVVGNDFLLTALSKHALISYSKDLLNDVEQLSEERKDIYIQSSAHGTVAIILYEFASGMGPSSRYFFDRHPFTQQIKQGPAMRWALSRYFENSEQPFVNLRYQFSPLYQPGSFRPKTWPFGLHQHALTLSERNISQFVLGSFNMDIQSQGEEIFIHLWNQTSRKSLFWGFGKKVQRPLPFGTISQHIFLTYSREEAGQLVNLSGEKSGNKKSTH